MGAESLQHIQQFPPHPKQLCSLIKKKNNSPTTLPSVCVCVCARVFFSPFLVLLFCAFLLLLCVDFFFVFSGVSHSPPPPPRTRLSTRSARIIHGNLSFAVCALEVESSEPFFCVFILLLLLSLSLLWWCVREVGFLRIFLPLSPCSCAFKLAWHTFTFC